MFFVTFSMTSFLLIQLVSPNVLHQLSKRLPIHEDRPNCEIVTASPIKPVTTCPDEFAIRNLLGSLL